MKLPNPFKGFKNLFKSKKTRHRERLLKDYQEGKILKFEVPKEKKKNIQDKKKRGFGRSYGYDKPKMKISGSFKNKKKRKR